jgi:hypothetical protein
VDCGVVHGRAVRTDGKHEESKNRRIEGRKITLRGWSDAGPSTLLRAGVMSVTTIWKHKHLMIKGCLCFQIVVTPNRA